MHNVFCAAADKANCYARGQERIKKTHKQMTNKYGLPMDNWIFNYYYRIVKRGESGF